MLTVKIRVYRGDELIYETLGNACRPLESGFWHPGGGAIMDPDQGMKLYGFEYKPDVRPITREESDGDQG